MTENKRHFNLSYGMEGVVWDGKQLVKKKPMRKSVTTSTACAKPE